MNEKTVSWEIVVCGLLMTGMAVMLAIQKPSVRPMQHTPATFLGKSIIPIPPGPSCDVRVTAPTAALPVTPKIFIHKDLKINLDGLEQLKELKKLEVLSQDENQGKRIIIIKPNADGHITISG